MKLQKTVSSYLLVLFYRLVYILLNSVLKLNWFKTTNSFFYTES